MEWFYGLTRFCWLGEHCAPDWDAWAAIGAWAAALATLLAVVVPAVNYRREIRRKEQRDKVVAGLELNRVLVRVWDVAAQYNALRGSVPGLPAYVRERPIGNMRGLTFSYNLAAVTLAEGMEEVVLALTDLEACLETWNSIVDDTRELRPGDRHPLNNLELLTAMLDRIEQALARVQAAANKLPGIEVDLPINVEHEN